jgi:hypothetical protein
LELVQEYWEGKSRNRWGQSRNIRKARAGTVGDRAGILLLFKTFY